MSEASGPQWCARFPASTALDDLLPPFADRVRAFVSRLERAGAQVTVQATFRPPERAWLMHWCCMVGQSGQDPDQVPVLSGVAIDWTHGGDHVAARTAARRMMARYDIAFPAALVSRHTQRRAIDMTIRWQGSLRITDFDGRTRVIARPPRTGSNPQLAQVGASFGVLKLAKDPPHWSDDGH